MAPPILRPEAQPRPRLETPAGACDCHCHVFGPEGVFPYAEGRRYTPPDATFDDYARLMAHLGIARAVIVQPTPYGKDHGCMLDALRRLGGRGRGIAIVDAGVTDRDLEELTALGMRGTRVGLTHGYGPALDSLGEVARRLGAHGWHIDVALDAARLPEFEAMFRALPVDLVVDHIGRGDPAAGVDEPGFRTLLAMLREGRTWVKLSAPYYASREGPPVYGDVAPRVRALVEANPRRVVWATNWPHTSTDLRPSDSALLDLLCEWVADAATRRRILVDNPAELYGFE